MTPALALMLAFGLVLIVSMWWADALERQQRLRERCDVTPSLPVAICKPAAFRRGDWRIDRNLDRLGEPTTYVTRRHK